MWQSLIVSSLALLVVSPSGQPVGSGRAPVLVAGSRVSLPQPRLVPGPASPPNVAVPVIVRGPATLPTGPRRMIVEFTAEPAALARRSGRDATRARSALGDLRADLGSLGVSSGQVLEIRREYTEVFAGAAVMIDPASIPWLRSRPYVADVFPDDTVRATLSESVPLIGAPRVVQELGGTGTGIRVGIVDTGIDYRHVALGGGYGPGFRVAGGWDFANDDPDPLDDHGHGTHVAGIAAGNGGGILGVAPGATLYAFKVLNASGFGFDSDVLAGLDRVLDPDANPQTSDAAHVINLSLGGPGHAGDPLSRALDRLSDLGVVCVVAAGNDYSYFSIGSPGTSRRAITVGASTKNDAMAPFSSRGPAPRNFDLKPDLVAPGLDIVSAALGGGTLSASGTSMATPHVAGVAAQLRQLHPGWSVEQIKAALVSTSRDLGWQPFDQGAGRVDAYAAATVSFAVTPTRLAFGRIDPGPPTWSRRDTLHLSSFAAVPRTIDFPAITTLVAGATLTVTPASVTLPPGGTATVIAELVVDNALVPAPRFKPYGYATTVVATSAGEVHRIPAAFHEAATIEVPTSAFVNWILVHDRGATGFLDTFTPLFDGPALPVPAGNYDVMAWLSPPDPPHTPYSFVIRENVDIQGDTRLPVERQDARLLLRFENVDQLGAPVACNLGAYSLSHESAPFGIADIAPFNFLQVSEASAAYRLEWTRSATDFRKTRHTFSGALKGLQSSLTFSNRPDELRRMSWTWPQVAPSAAPIFWEQLMPHGYSPVRFAIFEPAIAPIRGPFAAEWWWMPAPYEGHLQSGGKIDLVAWESGVPVEDSLAAIGPMLRLDQWPLVGFSGDETELPWLRQSTGLVGLGHAPVVWHGRFQNHASTMRLAAGWPFRGAHLITDRFGGRIRHPDPAFTLNVEGGSPLSGTLAGTGGFLEDEFTVGGLPAGRHTLRTSFTAPFRSDSSTLDVLAEFDTRLFDSNPPWLRYLHIEVDGETTDSVAFIGASSAVVRFELVDDQSQLPVPSLAVREADQDWEPLVVEGPGYVYSARLPSHLDGIVAMRLEGTDPSGNSLVLHWDRAFVAQAAPASVLIALLSAAVVDGVVRLSWQLSPPGPESVTIQRREASGAWLAIGTAPASASGVIDYADSTAQAGHAYGYRVFLPNAGDPIHGGEVAITVSDRPVLALSGPRPNPVTAQPFTIELSLASAGHARLSVHDVAGREVLNHDLGTPGAGRRSIRIGEGVTLRPGLYFVKLEQGGQIVTRRVCILGR
jgi:subtilisin family serine protease